MTVNQQTGMALQRMRLTDVTAPTGVTGARQLLMTATGAPIGTGVTGAGVTGLVHQVPYISYENLGVLGVNPARAIRDPLMKGVDATFLRGAMSPFSSPTGLPSGTGPTILRTLTIRGPQQ